MANIRINERTRQHMQEIVRAINDLQQRLQLLQITYLDAHEAKGEYRISDDLSEFIEMTKE